MTNWMRRFVVDSLWTFAAVICAVVFVTAGVFLVLMLLAAF